MAAGMGIIGFPVTGVVLHLARKRYTSKPSAVGSGLAAAGLTGLGSSLLRAQALKLAQQFESEFLKLGLHRTDSEMLSIYNTQFKIAFVEVYPAMMIPGHAWEHSKEAQGVREHMESKLEKLCDSG